MNSYDLGMAGIKDNEDARRILMEDFESKVFNPMEKIQDSQIPDDTITIIIKCGGRTYFRGINLEDTQEKTAKLTTILMQQVVDTVDAKGLKAGGSLYDPNNKEG